MSWSRSLRTLRSMWCSKRPQVPGQLQEEPHWAVRSPQVRPTRTSFANCYGCSESYSKRQRSTRRNNSSWSSPLLANFPEARLLGPSQSLRIRSTRDCWQGAPSAFDDELALPSPPLLRMPVTNHKLISVTYRPSGHRRAAGPRVERETISAQEPEPAWFPVIKCSQFQHVFI